jgi:hypothetical protein
MTEIVRVRATKDLRVPPVMRSCGGRNGALPRRA